MKKHLGGHHYNFDAPVGQWRPQHRKSISLMATKTMQVMPEIDKKAPSKAFGRRNASVDLGTKDKELVKQFNGSSS